MDAEFDIDDTVFQDVGGEFDRFDYVVMFDLTGTFRNVLPYIYARNITRIREMLNVTSINTLAPSLVIELGQYAVRDELLIISVNNPELIFSLVARQDAILPTLYQEIIDLQSAEMLDSTTAKSLRNRLEIFLQTIKVGSYEGDGIFWFPENYLGEGIEDEGIVQEDDEDYENYMRRSICTHIKCRRLPMLHLFKVSDERGRMLLDLIEGISSHTNVESVFIYAQLTHFAPYFRNRIELSDRGLKTLMAEEFRCVRKWWMVIHVLFSLMNISMERGKLLMWKMLEIIYAITLEIILMN